MSYKTKFSENCGTNNVRTNMHHGKHNMSIFSYSLTWLRVISFLVIERNRINLKLEILMLMK